MWCWYIQSSVSSQRMRWIDVVLVYTKFSVKSKNEMDRCGVGVYKVQCQVKE